MQQAHRQAVAVVGGTDLVPQPFEPLPIGARDLGVDDVEERQRGKEILPRSALPAGVVAARSTGTAGRLVVWQRVQASEQIGIIANFAGGSGSWAPSTNLVTRTVRPSKSDTDSSAASRSAGYPASGRPPAKDPPRPSGTHGFGRIGNSGS